MMFGFCAVAAKHKILRKMKNTILFNGNFLHEKLIITAVEFIKLVYFLVIYDGVMRFIHDLF